MELVNRLISFGKLLVLGLAAFPLAMVSAQDRPASEVPVEIKRALALGNRDKAVPWLHSAASSGNASAAVLLAKYYLSSDGGSDANAAISLLNQVAGTGLAEADFLLATQFEKAGKLELARQNYQSAKNGGHPRAAQRLNSLSRVSSVEDAFAAIAAGMDVSERLAKKQLMDKNASNLSLLAHAVTLEAQNWIDALMKLGADPNSADDQGNTTLHHALRKSAAENSDSLVLQLLAGGADSTIANKAGETPLHLAVVHNRLGVVRALIAAGARKTAKDRQGWTPEMLAERQGEPAMLALFGKAEKGRMAERALAPENANEALKNAIAAQNIKLTRVALSAKANVNVVDDAGNSSLALMAQVGNFEVARLLIERDADVGLANTQGVTPLMQAAGNGHTQIAEYLLSNGSESKNTDRAGKTALHHAVRGKHRELAMVLLARGSKVNALDINLRTPLWWAVRQSDSAMAGVLLKNGADLRPDKESVAPQHLAARQGDAGLLSAMLASFAPTKAELLDVRTKTGNTPIMLAAHKNAVAVVRTLIDHKVDVEAVNEAGDSALLIATKHRSLDSARLLLKVGASLNRRNNQLVSARMLIEERGDEQWLQMMDAAPSELSSLFSKLSGN